MSDNSRGETTEPTTASIVGGAAPTQRSPFQFSLPSLLIVVAGYSIVAACCVSIRPPSPGNDEYFFWYAGGLLFALYVAKFIIWWLDLDSTRMVVIYCLVLIGELAYIYAALAPWNQGYRTLMLFSLLLLPIMILTVPTTTFLLDVAFARSRRRRSSLCMIVRTLAEVAAIPGWYFFCIFVGILTGLVPFVT